MIERKPTKPVSTPWGPAQSIREYGPGVVEYSTASHGGFHVSGAALKRIPEAFHVGWAGGVGWYEEDCDWAIVAHFLPEFFSPEELAYVESTLKHYRPEVLATEAK